MTNSSESPPRWIRRLLSMVLDSRTLEACLGDLEEKFNAGIRGSIPRWKMKLFYSIEALGFLRMARLRKFASIQMTANMVRHTLLFFTRLVRKDLSYYLVSLFGLALSLCSFLFITMFIADEIS